MNNLDLRFNGTVYDKTNVTFNTLILKYPCSSTYQCAEYSLFLNPGSYKIEAYGASGGSYNGIVSSAINSNIQSCISQDIVHLFNGNTYCYLNKGDINHPGAGGYMSGIITLRKRTKIFVAVGGKGEFTKAHAPYGGYNGGGNALIWNDMGTASGGGATDIRLLENDFYHRVLVAGGGGGTDNRETYGGSGGYPDAQAFGAGSSFYSSPIASQLYGFSFGQGESGSSVKSSHPNATNLGYGAYDVGGAGGGWFGGFIGGSGSGGGAGGGSSFILKKGAHLPTNPIKRYTDKYILKEEKDYAFTGKSQYYFTDIAYATGIWSGNGFAKITLIKSLQLFCTKDKVSNSISYIFMIIMSNK